MKKALILLSGGLDSATCCAFAKKDGFELYAMTFDYGQRHSVEIDSARRLASFFKIIEHRIVNLDPSAMGRSALTFGESVPKNRVLDDSIPSTYVPARNTIFLSFALGWAEENGCRDIYTGVNAVDYSGYPDCRPEFIEEFEKLANLATKAGVSGDRFSVHAPLIGMTKPEIIRNGTEMGVDYAITHSCYDPDREGRSCGECDSCRLRKKGFEEAGIADPTVYSK